MGTWWILIGFSAILAALVFMLSVIKLPPFIALFLSAILTGVLTRMPPDELAEALTNGFGSMLSRIGTISTAAPVNDMVRDIIVAECSPYLLGELTLEEALSAALAKLDIYLSE